MSSKPSTKAGSSVRRPLRIIELLFIASAILGVFGAWEIAKGAKLHELNFQHLKYNHDFFASVERFAAAAPEDADAIITDINADLLNIRAQPIGCLEVAGPVERLAMRAIGVYEAIGLCKVDLALADDTIEVVAQYTEGMELEFPRFDGHFSAVEGECFSCQRRDRPTRGSFASRS